MGLEHFSAALDLLKGFHINLYVGDEVIKGKLMGVEADHIILEDENKFIFYYNIDKVQAITKNTRQFQSEEIKGNFPKTKSLSELLETFRNSWVSILCLNKQKFSGVLSDIDADFATLINGDERILIKLSHVSNILKGFIPEVKKIDAKESTKEEKTEEKAQAKSEEKVPEKPQPKLEKKPKPIPVPPKEVSKPAAEQKNQECLPCQNVDSSNKMGWSESIKDVPIKPLLGETSNVKKEEKIEPAAAPMISNDVNKTQTQPEKKTEEVAVAKLKPLTPIKPSKEEPQNMKSEKTTTSPMTIKEAKPVKKQEPQAAVKQETTNMNSTKTNTSDHSKKTVWSPSQQDERLFRFAGEPAPIDRDKNFPFAGWPNRSNNNRSSRNLFF